MADGSSRGPREGVSDEWDEESYDETVLHRDPIAVEQWRQQLAPMGHHDNGLEWFGVVGDVVVMRRRK